MKLKKLYNEMFVGKRTYKLHTESVNEGLYHVGYNKGRGQGTGVFKDSYSSYKDAKKAVEKLEKERGGSYNQIAYYVSDKYGKLVRESVIREDIKKDIDKFIDKLNKQFPDQEYTISSGGGKYVRINHKNRKFGGESAWGFISLVDNPTKGFKKGDLLKAAGYNTPAKHARGNILNGDAKYDKYSPTYLKEEINEGSLYSSQQWIKKLTPKIEKDVESLKKQFPKYDISLVKNRYESDGSYTLDISGKNTSDTDNKTIQKAVASKIKESVNESTEPEIITQLRDIVKNQQYQSVKDPSSGKKMKVDMQTANIVLKIYDGLSNANKQNMVKMGLPKMIDVSNKIASKKYAKKEVVDETQTEELDESLKNTVLTGLVLLSAIFGGNYINHGVQLALDAKKPVEVRTLHTLLSDKPLTRDTYILKVNPNQKDLVHVNPNTNTITLNTSDISNINLKRKVRNKIKKINPNATT
jgi:hypothetical protein